MLTFIFAIFATALVKPARFVIDTANWRVRAHERRFCPITLQMRSQTFRFLTTQVLVVHYILLPLDFLLRLASQRHSLTLCFIVFLTSQKRQCL